MYKGAVLKISLSFHYTGWFLGIPLLDYCNPKKKLGSIIPYNHKPTGVSNTAQVDMAMGQNPGTYCSEHQNIWQMDVYPTKIDNRRFWPSTI